MVGRVLRSCKGFVLVGTRLASTGGEDDADDEAIESKSFGKDEDENHAHKQLWLLSIGPAEEAKRKTEPNHYLSSVQIKGGYL
jgi:hypothetical protein